MRSGAVSNCKSGTVAGEHLQGGSTASRSTGDPALEPDRQAHTQAEIRHVSRKPDVSGHVEKYVAAQYRPDADLQRAKHGIGVRHSPAIQAGRADETQV